eukprot:3128307-Amphidinium_carterae.1
MKTGAPCPQIQELLHQRTAALSSSTTRANVTCFTYTDCSRCDCSWRPQWHHEDGQAQHDKQPPLLAPKALCESPLLVMQRFQVEQ